MLLLASITALDGKHAITIDTHLASAMSVISATRIGA